MTPFAGIISVVVALIAMIDWRRGFLAVIVIGVLQDVFRKLTPGAPAYFIIWAMAIYLGVVAVALLNKALPPFRSIYLEDRQVRAAWKAFLFLIILQLGNAFIRWGSPVVPIFGAVFYLGPLLAILISYSYAISEQRLRQYLGFYSLILVSACLTVYLSPLFQDSWPVLRDVGTFTGDELIIYDIGRALKSYSGILRTGEIASWHAATAAIFLATLALTARRRSHWLITAILIALLIGVIVLTGRRKMLMALSIFFIFQWALSARFKKGMTKISVLVILVGTMASFSFTLLEPSSESSAYVQRSTTVFGDAIDRMALAFRLMASAFNRSAGIGLGAGSAAQGGRHAGIDQSQLVGGSSESGLGMFMVELGAPGLLVALWLLIAISRSLFGNLKHLMRLDERLFLYQVSFLSFLFANLITFTVASQIYGDFFVLIILGTVAGFVFKINSVVNSGLVPARQMQIVATAKSGRESIGRT